MVRRLAIPALLLGCLSCRPHSSTPLRIEPAERESALATVAPHPGVTQQNGQTRISAESAGGEVTSFSFQITEAPSDTTSLGLTPTALQSGGDLIPASAFRLYRMHRVRVPRWPGWQIREVSPGQRQRYPADVLVPADAPHGALNGLDAQERQIEIWVDLAVPIGTPAGSYRGWIDIDDGRRLRARVGFELLVHGCDLPTERPCTLLVEFDTRRPGATALDPRRPSAADRSESVLGAMRLLSEHGLSPVLAGVRPAIKIDGQRKLRVDWAEYDAAVEPYLDGFGFVDGRPAPLWPIPFDETFPPRPEGGALGSPAFADVVRQYLRACADHFSARGWLERSFVRIEGADPSSPADVETFEFLSHLCRQADDRLEIVSTMFPQDLIAIGAVRPRVSDSRDWQVDVWMPRAQFFDPAAMRAERELGRQTWVQLDRPPYSGTLSLAGRPSDVRAIPWQSRRLAAPVVHLGVANAWPEAPAGDWMEACAASDPPPLLYPGQPFGLSSPVPSRRLKFLRQGLYDQGCLQLLEASQLSHIASTLTVALAPRAGAEGCGAHLADGRPSAWPADENVWDEARRIMMDEWARRPEADAAGSMAADIRWRRFMESARSVDVCVEGIRLRSERGGAAGSMLMECAARTENHRRTPVAGLLSMEGLPAPWIAGPPRPFGPIPPESAQSLLLSGGGAGIPALVDGGSDLHFRLSDAEGGYALAETVARLALVSSARLELPIRLDADLSDWPLVPGNCAGDFLLISAKRRARNERDAADRPKHATYVFAAHDDRDLYLGIRSAAPRSQAVAARGNAHDYDDLIPRDADRIDLLFDTADQISRLPTDLFHLILLRSGGHVAERGVSLDPLLASAKPWPVDVRWQMREANGMWVIELRLPLSSLGLEPGRMTPIGFNIARYDVQEDELSTWSGAPGNLFDPMSLGNLVIP